MAIGLFAECCLQVGCMAAGSGRKLTLMSVAFLYTLFKHNEKEIRERGVEMSFTIATKINVTIFTLIPGTVGFIK